MTVGFEVFNDQGYKIAGSDLPNLCFYGKGRIDVPAGGAPIPQVPGGVMNFYRSQYPLAEINGRIYLSNAVSGTQVSINGLPGWVEYWSFGPVSPPDVPTNHGLEIYSPEGVLTFNTARPFLKLLGRTEVTIDNYKVLHTGTGWREYRPVGADIPFSGGGLAFAIGNTRVYWTSTQVYDPQRGITFTDVWRYVRTMHIDSSGRFASGLRATSQIKYGGFTGNFNYSPNGAAAMTLLVADVSGL